MKKILYLIALVLIISCNKESNDSTDDNNGIPEVNDYGVLGTYLTEKRLVIQKATLSQIEYDHIRTTYRGYIFTPEKDMKITEIGGRIAETGKYRFEIYRLDPEVYFSKIETILVDSVTITDISIFQYKKLVDGPLLESNQKYIFRYFNQDHNSVYDAGLGRYQDDDYNNIKFPLKIKDITIESSYYTYNITINGEIFPAIEGEFWLGIIRGLVDFKYELDQQSATSIGN